MLALLSCDGAHSPTGERGTARYRGTVTFSLDGLRRWPDVEAPGLVAADAADRLLLDESASARAGLSDGDLTVILKNPNAGSFLGFVSTGGLSELTLTVGRAGIWPSIDNFTLAGAPSDSVVPEPATWAMMIVGFGLVGTMLRGAQGRRTFAWKA